MIEIGSVKIERQGLRPRVSASSPWYERIVSVSRYSKVMLGGVLVLAGVSYIITFTGRAGLLEFRAALYIISVCMFLLGLIHFTKFEKITVPSAAMSVHTLPPTIKTESDSDTADENNSSN